MPGRRTNLDKLFAFTRAKSIGCLPNLVPLGDMRKLRWSVEIEIPHITVGCCRRTRRFAGKDRRSIFAASPTRSRCTAEEPA